MCDVYVCVCVCVCTSTFLHMRVEAGEQPALRVIFRSTETPLRCRDGCSLAWRSSVGLDWLTEAPVNLQSHFSVLGISVLLHRTQSSQGLWGQPWDEMSSLLLEAVRGEKECTWHERQKSEGKLGKRTPGQTLPSWHQGT